MRSHRIKIGWIDKIWLGISLNVFAYLTLFFRQSLSSPTALPDGLDLPGRVFFDGVKQSTSQEALTEHFEQFGEIACLQLCGKKDVKNCGFVTFECVESAQLACAKEVHKVEKSNLRVYFCGNEETVKR